MEKIAWNRWIRKVKDISVIITCIGIIIGGIVTIANMRSTWRQARLAGLSQAKEIFSLEDDIQKEVNIFVNISSIPNAKKLLDKYQTGQAMYHSNELSRFYKIAHHYEKVGSLVKNGYLDFNLYFEVFAFPDKFWDKSKDLRDTIKQNWGGKGGKDEKGHNAQLNDFLSNTEYLGNRYKDKRSSILYKIRSYLSRM